MVLRLIYKTLKNLKTNININIIFNNRINIGEKLLINVYRYDHILKHLILL